ncbi:hypothetical protein GCM10027169_10230 [Gordonia jinhuaensis]|uniref:Amino acid permease/ SLC12A domain-containing protein n=1 Tax=Gordonia jinhuaensis TaxID=1517702 RepID=A0A916SV43_9ACTN|nr:hypothetical protein GCM10011489_04390 [Gordonia jinhuaensis]
MIMMCLAVTVAVEMIPLMGVVLGSPSMKDLLSSDSPMNYFLTARGGSTLNVVVSVGIAIAIINAVIAIILQIARLLFSSARDRSWPDPVDKVLGSVHPTLHSPVAATLVVGAIAAVTAAFVPLNWLITATGANGVIVYLVVALAALRLRRKGGATSRGYRMRWWPLAPVVVIAICGYIIYSMITPSTWTQLAVAVVTMAIGVVYYLAYLHPRRGDRWTLPDPIHEDEIDEAGKTTAA